LNPLVSIADFADFVVAPKLICVDRGGYFSWHLLEQNWHERYCLDIGHYFCHDITASLDYAHHRGFGFKASPSLPPFAAEVRLVNLNIAIHRLLSLSHDSPDLVEHSPGCLVGHSQLTLKLFGRDTASGGGHKEHGIEPGAERSGAMVKKSIRCRAYLVSAKLTLIGFASFNAIMLCYFATLWAQDTFRPASLNQKIEANLIVRELLVKGFESVFRYSHCYHLSDRFWRFVLHERLEQSIRL